MIQTAAGITESQRGEDINLFLNTTNIVKALAFDCLNRRPPNVRRPEPVGMYDTLFGIEYTYESLRALPNAFNGRNIRSMNFSPRCIAARQAYDRVEAPRKEEVHGEDPVNRDEEEEKDPFEGKVYLCVMP